MREKPVTFRHTSNSTDIWTRVTNVAGTRNDKAFTANDKQIVVFALFDSNVNGDSNNNKINTKSHVR